MAAICERAAERVAARLAAAYLGPDFDGEYAPRFAALAEELRRDYAVDCSPLYGLDLSMMPSELAALLNRRLEQQASRLGQSEGGGDAFHEAARLLYLQVCGDLWPGHIALLAGLSRQPVAQLATATSRRWRSTSGGAARHGASCGSGWTRSFSPASPPCPYPLPTPRLRQSARRPSCCWPGRQANP